MAKVKWLGAIGEAVLRDYRGVAQLTTPVQRIDQSRFVLDVKTPATADRER
ncbi:MAG: hypothetical protein HC899_26490 [Leptolyngbyaceae cyanobacterium SM1_4_3]|nr:hypothetical protein [Leptolyngbyaceae cyanobacterium SM1_4_3]